VYPAGTQSLTPTAHNFPRTAVMSGYIAWWAHQDLDLEPTEYEFTSRVKP
jgi:hypothetical protein